MKRILHIVSTLDCAGIEKQVSLLAQGLPRAEFESHVCALTGGGPLVAVLTEAAIPVTVIGHRWRFDPRAWWHLRKLLDELHPDLVHAWTPEARAYGYTAGWGCGARHAVAVQQDADPSQTAAERVLDRYICRRCDLIVADSLAARGSCLRHGVPAEKVRVVPTGVPAAPAPTATRQQLLDELGLPENSRLVGMVGRLRPTKRVKDAIWAADLLKVIRDDVHLVIIGDGPHRDRLLRYRDQVEIGDKVHFLGQRGDVSRWMSHFEVLWSPSGCDSRPSAVLEAMAAGVPVVAADIPGIRDVVVPETTGYLVKVGHRAGFARWTNHLLDHPEVARQLGAAGRDRVLREFCVEKMVEGHAGLYRELFGGR